ncbi:metal-dependent hydrolase [Novosphingopyxis sp.]|uniref:metal-dependent hydrolase n=1 Tax=Novosphingopyxis sp. TaxID=2709690 RepID=UPI003B5CFF48
MDNFTHSLTGWALGQTGLKRKTGLGLTVLILGANMPDIDVLAEPLFGLPSIQYHRGFTHGIGGVLTMPLLLAGLLWMLDRWQRSNGERAPDARWWRQWHRRPLGRDPVRFGWLVALAYAGTLTHPLLDFTNTYGIQLLAPFSERWFHGDTLFIIDVWIWSALALSIWLSRRWEKARRPEWRRPAIAGLVAVVAYIGANAALSHDVESGTRALAQARYAIVPDFLMAGEEPVKFWRRETIWRRGNTLGRTSYDALGGRMTSLGEPVDTGMNDPAIAIAARQDRQLAAFLNWSLVPTARVERHRGVTAVSVGDARFADPRTAGNFSRQVTLEEPE